MQKSMFELSIIYDEHEKIQKAIEAKAAKKK
jgi:hypothetical protein